MRINPREFLCIPNILTSIRIVLLPLLLYLIIHGHDYIALGFILFGMVTDIFDGYLARRLNQITELGKILDPVSDKLSTASLVIVLALYRDFPPWAAIFIISRDVLILFGASFYIASGRPTPMSNLLGKLTALAWAAAIAGYLTPWHTVSLIILYIAVAMVPLSFVFYVVNTLRQRRAA